MWERKDGRCRRYGHDTVECAEVRREEAIMCLGREDQLGKTLESMRRMLREVPVEVEHDGRVKFIDFRR